MYEHLLVALDGSLAAEQVLDHAEALASAFGSTVTLLRATVSPEMVVMETAVGDGTVGENVAAIDPEPIVEAEEVSATEYLDRIAGRLRQRQVTVNVEHIEGAADEVIVERARALGIGLVLMTTHGRGGLGRLVFGSVADAVLRHAPCPVLLVRVEHDQESA